MKKTLKQLRLLQRPHKFLGAHKRRTGRRMKRKFSSAKNEIAHKWRLGKLNFDKIFHPEKYQALTEHLQNVLMIAQQGWEHRCLSACWDGNYVAAQQWALRMQRCAPQWARGWIKMSEVCLAMGDNEGALTNAENALTKAYADPFSKREMVTGAMMAYHDALVVGGWPEEAANVERRLKKEFGVVHLEDNHGVTVTGEGYTPPALTAEEILRRRCFSSFARMRNRTPGVEF